MRPNAWGYAMEVCYAGEDQGRRTHVQIRIPHNAGHMVVTLDTGEAKELADMLLQLLGEQARGRTCAIPETEGAEVAQ